MRLTIEIAAAALLVFCISATSAAFAAGKAGRSADGLSCAFSVREKRLARRALRRDPPAMRRKILRQLLRRQDAVGDVSGKPLRTASAALPIAVGRFHRAPHLQSHIRRQGPDDRQTCACLERTGP